MTRRIESARRLLLLAVVVLCWGQALHAHVQRGESVSFRIGFQHPISGWDHVVAMIAVGLWGAQLGAPAIWVLPVAFPMVMAMGGMLGLMGVPLPGTEIGIAASAILLGSAVLSELRPPLVIAVVVVTFFAIFHGYAHGAELPPGQSGLLYSMGFVIIVGSWDRGRGSHRRTGALAIGQSVQNLKTSCAHDVSSCQ